MVERLCVWQLWARLPPTMAMLPVPKLLWTFCCCFRWTSWKDFSFTIYWVQNMPSFAYSGPNTPVSKTLNAQRSSSSVTDCDQTAFYPLSHLHPAGPHFTYSLSCIPDLWLGPFHGAIAVPSVTHCRCRCRWRCCGHRCAGGISSDIWWMGVQRLAVAKGPNIFQMLLVFAVCTCCTICKLCMCFYSS